MVSPQLEDGHVRIANELYDAILRFPFSKRELKIVLAIIRKTYGFSKKEDQLSAGQIARITGIQRQNVVTVIGHLEAACVVSKRDGSHANYLSINKNYQQWTSLKTRLVSKRDGGSLKMRLNLVSKRDPQQTTQQTTPIGEPEKTNCPENFPLTDEMLAYAKKKGVTNPSEVESMTERFLNHHAANGNTFADWYRAWQNWTARHVEYRGDSTNPDSPFEGMI